MSIELSIPFSMLGSFDMLEPALIGDAVRIEGIQEDWFESVKEQCPTVSAREQSHFSSYTNRFYIALDPEHSSPLDITEAEIQPLFRAVVLSHIVKPNPVAIDDVKIKTVYEQDGKMVHHCEVGDCNMTVALVSPAESYYTITHTDCDLMSLVWPAFSEILEDSNRPNPKYDRIVRAIKNFEYAHYIYFANLSYLVYHAALEFIIYFGQARRTNQAQIVKRLPLMLPNLISPRDADAIYRLNLHYKHGPDPAGPFLPASSDTEVMRLTALLRESVRQLLLRAIQDRSFADALADHGEMKKQFGVVSGKQGTTI